MVIVENPTTYSGHFTASLYPQGQTSETSRIASEMKGENIFFLSTSQTNVDIHLTNRDSTNRRFYWVRVIPVNRAEGLHNDQLSSASAMDALGSVRDVSSIWGTLPALDVDYLRLPLLNATGKSLRLNWLYANTTSAPKVDVYGPNGTGIIATATNDGQGIVLENIPSGYSHVYIQLSEAGSHGQATSLYYMEASLD